MFYIYLIRLISGECGSYNIHWKSPKFWRVRITIVRDTWNLWIDINGYKAVKHYGHWSEICLGGPAYTTYVMNKLHTIPCWQLVCITSWGLHCVHTRQSAWNRWNHDLLHYCQFSPTSDVTSLGEVLHHVVNRYILHWMWVNWMMHSIRYSSYTCDTIDEIKWISFEVMLFQKYCQQ